MTALHDWFDGQLSDHGATPERSSPVEPRPPRLRPGIEGNLLLGAERER